MGALGTGRPSAWKLDELKDLPRALSPVGRLPIITGVPSIFSIMPNPNAMRVAQHIGENPAETIPDRLELGLLSRRFPAYRHRFVPYRHRVGTVWIRCKPSRQHPGILVPLECIHTPTTVDIVCGGVNGSKHPTHAAFDPSFHSRPDVIASAVGRAPSSVRLLRKLRPVIGRAGSWGRPRSRPEEQTTAQNSPTLRGRISLGPPTHIFIVAYELDRIVKWPSSQNRRLQKKSSKQKKGSSKPCGKPRLKGQAPVNPRPPARFRRSPSLESERLMLGSLALMETVTCPASIPVAMLSSPCSRNTHRRHALPSDDFPSHIEAGLSAEPTYEKPLGPAIAVPERVQVVETDQKGTDYRCELVRCHCGKIGNPRQARPGWAGPLACPATANPPPPGLAPGSFDGATREG
jgi:hypothetical protein